MQKRINLHLLIVLLTMTSLVSSAQQHKAVEVDKQLMKEIYNDVWSPFIHSYNDVDIEKFKSIHSQNFLKINIDKNNIESKKSYFGNMGGFFNMVKTRGRSMGIQFSILSTAVGEGKVYQRGYYHFLSSKSKDEQLKTRGYGLFNVTLVKENGRLKQM